jgi:hypothetical protein
MLVNELLDSIPCLTLLRIGRKIIPFMLQDNFIRLTHHFSEFIESNPAVKMFAIKAGTATGDQQNLQFLRGIGGPFSTLFTAHGKHCGSAEDTLRGLLVVVSRQLLQARPSAGSPSRCNRFGLFSLVNRLFILQACQL